jgi:hypothetical protein
MNQILLQATTSLGTLTITPGLVSIRLAGQETAIQRSNIVGVQVSLGMWYFVGFLRVLRIYVNGQNRPVTLKNMRKSKAMAAKSLLGF